MSKKIISLLLSAVFSMSALAACSAGTETVDGITVSSERKALAESVVKSICAEDKEAILGYGFDDNDFEKAISTLSESKKSADMDDSDKVSLGDMTIYISGAFSGKYSETETTSIHIISKKLPSLYMTFVIEYDSEIEKYVCMASNGIRSSSSSDNYDNYSSNFSKGGINSI